MRHPAALCSSGNLARPPHPNCRRRSANDPRPPGQGRRRRRPLRGRALCRRQVPMLMQNHGFLAAINGIVSFAHLYKIPLLMLISYRGAFGERDPWQTQGGNVTQALLHAMGIPYSSLDDTETVGKRIRQAQTLAESSLQ